MGQYRQWLHYRHVAQQLQTQKEHLTTELRNLQERIYDPNVPPLDADNHIVQALTLYTKTSSALSQELLVEQGVANGHIQQPEIVSQALFDHSRLPNLESLHVIDIQEPTLPKRPTNAYTPLSPTPHKAIDLVPESRNTCSDEHEQTEPQIVLPWWLRKAALSATQSDTLDSQSVRTNRLVQRWLERWGRQEEQTPSPPQANGQQGSLQQERKQE